MLTQEEDVEIHALRKQGWSISAFARHSGRDRKTVRAYRGVKAPRIRARPASADDQGAHHAGMGRRACTSAPPRSRAGAWFAVATSQIVSPTNTGWLPGRVRFLTGAGH